MYKLNENKGITFILLVVTAIILLFLFCVSLVLSDNIITKSQEVVNIYNESVQDENNKLNEFDSQITI